MSAIDPASLPPVLDVPTAGRLLGLGRSAAYDLIVAGLWPTPVLRLGRRLRIPTAPLLALLGLDPVPLSQSGGIVPESPTAPAALSELREDES
jgi:predicted DNA-binding transcriptional regulator AlpA